MIQVNDILDNLIGLIGKHPFLEVFSVQLEKLKNIFDNKHVKIHFLGDPNGGKSFLIKQIIAEEKLDIVFSNPTNFRTEIWPSSKNAYQEIHFKSGESKVLNSIDDLREVNDSNKQFKEIDKIVIFNKDVFFNDKLVIVDWPGSEMSSSFDNFAEPKINELDYVCFVVDVNRGISRTIIDLLEVFNKNRVSVILIFSKCYTKPVGLDQIKKHVYEKYQKYFSELVFSHPHPEEIENIRAVFNQKINEIDLKRKVKANQTVSQIIDSIESQVNKRVRFLDIDSTSIDSIAQLQDYFRNNAQAISIIIDKAKFEIGNIQNRVIRNFKNEFLSLKKQFLDTAIENPVKFESYLIENAKLKSKQILESQYIPVIQDVLRTSGSSINELLEYEDDLDVSALLGESIELEKNLKLNLDQSLESFVFGVLDQVESEAKMEKMKSSQDSDDENDSVQLIVGLLKVSTYYLGRNRIIKKAERAVELICLNFDLELSRQSKDIFSKFSFGVQNKLKERQSELQSQTDALALMQGNAVDVYNTEIEALKILNLNLKSIIHSLNFE